MDTYNIHEAKTHLSKLVELAAKGQPFVIAKAGKPLVKVMALSAPEPARMNRIGFMAGEIKVPGRLRPNGIRRDSKAVWNRRMTLLLDTHLLLWAAEGAGELPKAATEYICDQSNTVAFSAASIWEIAIKSSLGRQDFKANPHLLRTKLIENGYTELRISSEHALAVTGLPDHHKDPFDRLLIAQASVEGLTLLTSDEVVASYPGPIIKV